MVRLGIGRSPAQTVIVGAGDYASLSDPHSLAAASSAVDIRILELLAARLCHELSGPIAAIGNGIELLAEEDVVSGAGPGASFMRDAVALVSDSARRAGNRLRFYRFAYGFSRGSIGVGPAPHELACGFFDASRIGCEYPASIRALPPHWQKLACNLLSVGADALPRGGRLVLTDEPLNLEAIGDAAALPPETCAALMMTTPIDELTPRTVQAYFTARLAKALDRRFRATAEPGRLRLTAVAVA